MPPPTREELARHVGQRDYGPVTQDCYCEVRYDDEFHREQHNSAEYDNRQMWRLPAAKRIEIRTLLGGGSYICNECYMSLPYASAELPRTQKTRKSMKLGSKPPRVRRIPV